MLMSKLESILKLKCPQCRKGNLFVKTGLFRYKKILLMHNNCPNCGLKYELEPGFWIGSLWTSYPIIVVIELPFLLCALIYPINILTLFLTMSLTMLLFYPLMLRLGRAIWIHIFISKNVNIKNKL